MVCGDANWCSMHEECMSDAQISVTRKCPDWEWNELDALTLIEWKDMPPRKRPVLDGQMKLGFEEDA
jgi:hypothetical protein